MSAGEMARLSRRVGVVFAIGLSTMAAGCMVGGEDEDTGVDDAAEETGEADQALTTWNVGPTRTYKTLASVASLVQPGDTVLIDGGATYAPVVFSKSGTSAAKITIKGVRVNGKRPVFSGGTNTLDIGGSNLVFEGLDITGGSFRCVFNRGHNITIRDTVVHGCPKHGILGADAGAGSLTLSYVEVYGSGYGTTNHPLYIATDETAHPGAVFRMENCYVHDNNGGNAVKSRAQRNEIYYNWIDGSNYRALELIGPDGQTESLAREDSDVVGNVLRQTTAYYMIRAGGDGTGQTWGRYRFVNNTMIAKSNAHAIFQPFDGIESMEMHNNVLWSAAGGAVAVIREDSAKWKSGRRVGGTNNWVPTGTPSTSGWAGTRTGSNPGFVSASTGDFRLLSTSPLINMGVTTTVSPSGYAFPTPLALPKMLPPLHAIQALGTAKARTVVSTVDIGAFEYN